MRNPFAEEGIIRGGQLAADVQEINWNAEFQFSGTTAPQ